MTRTAYVCIGADLGLADGFLPVDLGVSGSVAREFQVANGPQLRSQSRHQLEKRHILKLHLQIAALLILFSGTFWRTSPARYFCFGCETPLQEPALDLRDRDALGSDRE